nr:unnamed protein product [Callosobruchus chinensis]
MFVHPSGLT